MFNNIIKDIFSNKAKDNSDLIFNNNIEDYNKISKKIIDPGCVVLKKTLNVKVLKKFHLDLLECYENIKNNNFQLDESLKTSVLQRGVILSKIFSRYFKKDADFIINQIGDLIKESGLKILLNEVLGEDVYMVPDVFFRIKSGHEPNAAIPFHQHLIEGDTFDRPFLLAISIPFAPYDQDHPRMEIVARKTNSTLPINQNPKTPFKEFEIDELLVKKRYSSDLWSPKVEVGDIFIFRESNIHRTLIERGMTKTRTSVDIRLFSKIRSPKRFENFENAIKI
jgi:hypothetical protein